MTYRIAADILVILHLLWIVFLIFGASVGRRIAWVRWLHIGGLVFSFLMQIFSWTCPLTDMERWFRSREGGTPDYTGSFIAHYAERWVYLEVPEKWLLAATACVAAASFWIYLKNQDKTERHS